MSAATVLQTRIFEIIEAHVDLAKIFYVQPESATESAPLPRLVFDSMETRPTDYDANAEQHLIRFSIWSNLYAQVQVAKLAQELRDAFISPINISGHEIIHISFDRLDSHRDNKDRLWQAQLIFDVLTETTN